MSKHATTQLELAPESLDALRCCFERELRHQRVFIPGSFNLREQQPCLFVLVHPAGPRFAIQALVVYAKGDEPFAGVGLELVGLDREQCVALRAFIDTPICKDPNDERETPSRVEREAAAERSQADLNHAQKPRSLYERIRNLSLRERDQLARDGSLSDRVAVERTFGGSVWEALLQNPQLTTPEVAHIAKNGTLPVPLVGTIVSNTSWLKSPEVRRALLTNPRVNGPHLERVLKTMPRFELKQLSQASSCRQQVRAAAKKLLGE